MENLEQAKQEIIKRVLKQIGDKTSSLFKNFLSRLEKETRRIESDSSFANATKDEIRRELNQRIMYF